MRGATFSRDFRLNFSATGEKDLIKALRSTEDAQQRIIKSSAKVASSSSLVDKANAKTRSGLLATETAQEASARAAERLQRELLDQAAAAAKAANSADLTTRAGRAQAREASKLSRELQGTARATGKASAANRDLTVTGDRAAGSTRRIGHEARATETRLTSMGRRGKQALAWMGAGGVLYGAGRGIRMIADETVQFDKGMRNVNSIAQLSERRFKGVSGQVLGMAGKVAQAPRTLAAGMYDLVSSGFKANQSLRILKSSAMAATAGLTTTEVATKTVAAVLNSYKLPAKEAKDVSDVLFRIVDRGVISFEALSTTIGDVLPFASSLGVNLREVGGSVATMTKAGIGAPETMTRIKNVMVTMLKPGTALKEAIEDLGYESGESLIQAKGFQGALDALVGSTDGSKEAIAALFPNIRSLGGALALTGKNSRGASKDLKGMQAAGGATSKALSQQSKSIALQWQKLKVVASVMAVEFGDKLVPATKEVLSALNDDRLTNTQKLEKISEVLGDQTERALKRLPDLVEAVAPAIGEAGGHLGVALLEGMAKGFLQMDTLGQLFTVAAVMRLVGGPGALLAGGRAVGRVFGTGVGQGAATTVAAGGRGGGLKGMLGGAAMGGLVAGAGVLQMQQLVDAATFFGPSKNDPMDRLEQIEEKAGTVQAKIGGLFDKIPREADGLLGSLGVSSSIMRGASDLFGLADAGDQADKVGRLKEIFGEINNVGRERASQLKAESAELIKQLDATEAQKAAYTQLVSKPTRATIQNKAVAGIADLNSGSITRSQDIAKVVARTQAKINAGWAHGTDRWRKATAQGMNAQVRAIKAGMASGLVSTKKGQAQIAKVLREKRLVTGDDPVGIARGFAKSWEKTHKITPKQIQRYKRDLNLMPKAAQGAAINSMNALAQGLVKKGKLPEKELIKLQSALRTHFGQTGKQAFAGFGKAAEGAFGLLSKRIPKMVDKVRAGVKDGMDRTGKAAESGSKKASKNIGDLAEDAGRYSKRIKGSITGIPGPMRTAFTSMADYANTTATAFGSSKKVSLAFRGGGTVPSFAAGGLMPAMLSPGEIGRDPSGRWFKVPGSPVAADNVLMSLRPDTEIYTGSGQALLGMGFTREEALDNQMPHFAKGGKVPHGKLSGGAEVGRAAGQKGIDMGHAAAKAWIKKLGPKGLAGLKAAWDPSDPQGMVVLVGKALQKMGFAVGENPAFGSVGGHAEGSYHYSGRAIDVNADSMPGGEMKNLDSLYAKLKKIPHTELLWRVADHFDHLHYAFRKGGVVPAFAKGGKADKGLTVKGKVSWFNGPASTTASGTPVARPGLALNLKPGTTSAGWDNPTTDRWMSLAGKGKPVYGKTTIAGKTANLPIIDKGPHESTGRAIDVTEAGVRKLGMDPGAFPTDDIGKVVINGGSAEAAKTKTVIKITDDLKRMNARQARRAMPRLTRGFQGDAFSTAFETGRVGRGVGKAAAASARVKVTRTKKTVAAGSGAGGASSDRVKRMLGFANKVAAKKMPYQYGGGHSTLGRGNPSYDCSGYVSGILGAGDFINKPMPVARGTGLYTLGKAGHGKEFTWGVRGSSGPNAHTMIKIGKNYYESGSGHGPARVAGWAGKFSKRHIPGFRTGGKQGNGNARSKVKRGSREHAALTVGGVGMKTGKWLNELFLAGNRENKEVQRAMEELGDKLRRGKKLSVEGLVRLNNQLERIIKRTIDPKGPGGKAITKAEAAMIRRARSTVDLVQAGLGAKAGRRYAQANRIASKSDRRTFERDADLRISGVDPSSVLGLKYQEKTAKMQQEAAKRRRTQLKKSFAIAKKAGDRGTMKQLREELEQNSRDIIEAATTQAELVREAIKAAAAEGIRIADLGAQVKQLDLGALEARQRLSRTTDTPEAKLQQATLVGGSVASINAQRDAQLAAAKTYAGIGDMVSAQEALVAARQLEIDAMNATADAADLFRDAFLSAAQTITDIADSETQMQNTMYERFQLEQQIGGTFETGGYARRDFITANIIPSLTKELEAMEAQLAVIVTHGDPEQIRQKRQEIEDQRNEILRAQLEAQEAIKDNTDPKNIGGTLAFAFGGETMTDQFLLSGNGS